MKPVDAVLLLVVVAADEMVPQAESRFQSVHVVESEAECECQGE